MSWSRVRRAPLVKEGAHGSAFLEQKPKSLDDFILLPLGRCERNKSLKGARELVVCKIPRREGWVRLMWVVVEIELEVVGVEGAMLVLRVGAVGVEGAMMA